MSFVLEALKRSEQQRQVTSTPNLGSYVLPSRHGSQARPLGWLAAGTGLLLVAALLGWWLGNRPAATAAPTTQMAAQVPAQLPPQSPSPPAVQAIAPTPAPVRVVQANPVPIIPAPASRPPVMPAPQRVYVPPQPASTPPVKAEPRPAPAPTLAAPIPAARPAPVPTPVAAVPPPPAPAAISQPTPAAQTSTSPAAPMTIALPSLSKAKPVQPAATNTASGEAVGYSELPASVRQALPEMRLSGYMVDNNGRGLVGVNDQLVGEGEEISPGLVVEKIDPNGVVFRFRQYRFRR